mmetsp:Transcript_123472/g.214127  ORF Transcript_123472/g.214127 Transcript_123472/m.214127 type:complete len:80 (-) Transcript_123472:3873-4112(-)
MMSHMGCDPVGHMATTQNTARWPGRSGVMMHWPSVWVRCWCVVWGQAQRQEQQYSLHMPVTPTPIATFNLTVTLSPLTT